MSELVGVGASVKLMHGLSRRRRLAIQRNDVPKTQQTDVFAKPLGSKVVLRD